MSDVNTVVYPHLVFFKVPVTERDSLDDFTNKNILTEEYWEYVCSINGKRQHNTYDEYYEWAVPFCKNEYEKYISTTSEIHQIPVSSQEDKEIKIKEAKENGWEVLYV